MLTTKKFIKEAEKLGFRFLQCTKDIEIYYEKNQVAYVCWYRRFYVGITYEFRDLPKELQEKLFNLLVEYGRTPLDEREEPQKYYLKLIGSKCHNCSYLKYGKVSESFYIEDKSYGDLFQTQFTDKELDEFRKRFGITFNDFERIPVEEDEE